MPADRLPPRRGTYVAQLLWALAVVPACQHSSNPEQQQVDNAAQTFATICARCHGSDGKGGVAPEGSSPPRNFCDAAFQAQRTDDQLKQVIRKGKGAMPAFGNLFSDTDLQGLVHKIRSFNPDSKKP